MVTTTPEHAFGSSALCKAGEFVVTFPRAYHFSYGFNCGKAANLVTLRWLKSAEDAAVRRSTINYPSMVFHFQLLYYLVLGLPTRIPLIIDHNNAQLHKLREGSTIVYVGIYICYIFD